MSEWLIHIDQELLLAINGAHNAVLDTLMWWVSSPWVWVPLYVVLAGVLVYRLGWKRGLLYIAVIAIAVGLSDSLVHALKHWIMRFRPSNDPLIGPWVHVVNGYRGGPYGCPSSHAANTLCGAMLFGLLYNKRSALMWTLLMGWTLVISYSRMYLGVHYPLDILFGLTLGALLAVVVYYLVRLAEDVACRRSCASGQSDDDAVPEDQSACP